MQKLGEVYKHMNLKLVSSELFVRSCERFSHSTQKKTYGEYVQSTNASTKICMKMTFVEVYLTTVPKLAPPSVARLRFGGGTKKLSTTPSWVGWRLYRLPLPNWPSVWLAAEYANSAGRIFFSLLQRPARENRSWTVWCHHGSLLPTRGHFSFLK
jgi:hypothetical protein